MERAGDGMERDGGRDATGRGTSVDDEKTLRVLGSTSDYFSS